MVEALVALLLISFLLQAAWSIMGATRRAVERLVQRSEALETERIGWHVLSREVAAGFPARDWATEQGKALSLRAFRGVAEVCPGGGSASGAVVRYRGVRLPEPDKDSLLLLDAGGSWRAVKLVGREPASASCGTLGRSGVERWAWDPPVPGALLARLFERGSYHLENGALRYRLGAAGRQPLTPERLQDEGSAFVRSPGALELRLHVHVDEGVVHEWTRTLSREEGGG